MKISKITFAMMIKSSNKLFKYYKIIVYFNLLKGVLKLIYLKLLTKIKIDNFEL